jgi:hypothetical protein
MMEVHKYYDGEHSCKGNALEDQEGDKGNDTVNLTVLRRQEELDETGSGSCLTVALVQVVLNLCILLVDCYC